MLCPLVGAFSENPCKYNIVVSALFKCDFSNRFGSFKKSVSPCIGFDLKETFIN